MEEKQLEFVRSLYGKYGITDESKISYAAQAFKNDFDGTLKAFYSKYNPEKEIDSTYFNQIKSSYFSQADPAVQVEDVNGSIDQQQAPSGFFGNLSNTLSNIPEDIAGGFWQIANFIDRGGNIIDKAVYDLTGVNMKFDKSILPAQEAAGRVGSPNTEYIMGKIAENEASRLPVKGFTEAEGVGEIASATLNSGVQFLRSIVTGRLTMGAAPIIEQYESMYLDAVEAKAQQMGVNPMQLVVNGQDDDLEPMLYGAAAALLENIGLKGVSQYINSMPQGMKSEVFKWLYSNAKEGGTEWGQEMLSFLNEERAKGVDMGDAISKAFERGFSAEGVESFIGGFAGAAVIGATGKAIKNAIGKGETEEDQEAPAVTPEQEQAVKNKINAAASVVKAAEATVDTGDAEIDQLVQNTLRETEQALESKLLQEEQENARLELEKQKEKEVKQQEVQEKKQETAKQKAQEKVDQAVAQDVSKTVKDKASLKKAVYSFLGVSDTNKEDVDQVNSYVNFFDGIASSRSKREGISKEEWYKSRVASIGTTKDDTKKTGVSFLEDGRATIVALQAGSPREFFRSFAQVIQRDLDETESSALEAEFGINFKQDLSDESIDTFGQAFESYLQTGAVPDGIKGNNASFVRAAFEKISNWLKDIKSAIEGESSLYINSNVRRIFDSIVTGQEIVKEQEQTQEEIVDTTTETEANTNEQLDRTVDVNQQVSGNEVAQAGAVVTGTAGNEEVVDLTQTQETVENEQETKEEGNEGILSAPKATRVRPQADARKRRDDTFAKASKPFEAKPNGGIKGGEEALKSAIKSLIDLQNDPEQDPLTKEDARREMIRLSDIQQKAATNKQLRDERDSRLDDIRKEAKNNGYQLRGINSFFSKKSLVPVAYDNGEVLYFDTDTGVPGSYSLFEEKATTGVTREQWDERANDRFKKEDERRSERALRDLAKKEAEERAKMESSKKSELDKESDKANSVYQKTLNQNPTVKGLSEVIDSVLSIDIENAFSSKREGDVTKSELELSVKRFINKFLKDVKSFSSDKEMLSNKKKYDDIQDKIFYFARNSTLLSEKDRRSIIDSIRLMDKMFNLAMSDQEARKLKKQQDKIIGSKKGTILDDRTTVQSFGFESEKSSMVTGMLSDFLRGFGLKRRIIVVDSDFFSNNSRPEFKGLSDQEIIDIRNKEIDRISAIFQRQKIHDPVGGFKERSYDVVIDQVAKQIGYNVSGYSVGSMTTGSKFSIMVINSSKKNYLHTATHEFGHSLKFDLFNKIDDSTKESILNEYKEWLKKKKNKSSGFFTPSTISIGLSGKEGLNQFSYYGETFSEYFAEQVSYWANTQEKPSNVVEKFFGDVAKALKKLFEKFREDYGVSDSITKLLNDQFSFDGFRATEQQKASRDFIIDESAKVVMGIMDNNRKLVDVNSIISSIRATSIEEAKEAAAKKAANRKVKEALEAKNEIAQKKLDEFYEEYKLNGGTMSRGSFNEKVNKLADERLTRKIVSDTLGRLSDMYGDGESDGDTDDGPAVDFSRTINPRSGDKRKIFLDKITTAIDGKFSSISEFNKIIKQINKSLKAAGEEVISSSEKKKIFNGTKSGSIAQILLPLERKILRSKPTKDSVELIKSFSATRQERDAALAEADAMVKAGGPLTPEDAHKFNRLQLVGLFNTTVDERKQLIKDGVGKAVADKELSRINHRVAERSNSDRITIASAFYKSVMGFKKISEGIFEGVINGKKYQFEIFDRNKMFRKGDLVEYGSKLYRVSEHIDAFDTGFLLKMNLLADFNERKTNAELAIASKKKGFISKLNEAFLGTSGIESLANMIKDRSEEGAFEGELSDMLGTYGFRQAAMNKRNHNFKVEEMYKNLGERIFGVKGLTKVNKKIYDMKTTIRTIKYTDKNGNTIEKQLSVGEMMTWYAYMGQPDLVARFKNMEKQFADTPDSANFWNDSKRDAIIDSLKDQEKEFVKGVITEVMPYVYGTLNKAHQREMGYDLQLVENYFPTFAEAAETDSRQMSVIDTSSEDFENFLSSVSNRNIKERRSNSALIARDFFGQFMQYSDRAFHYSEYVGPLKRASLLFQNQDYGYSGYMSNTFGKEIMRQIKINLDNIAFGGASRVVGMKHSIADTLRALNIGGAFMANITMIPKQVSSFIALADSMSWRDFSKYYITTDWKSRLSDMKEIYNMNFMKERLRQGGRLSYDTQGLIFESLEKELSKSTLAKKSETAIAMINKVLFSPVMIGDAGAVYMGGAPLLNDLKKKAKLKYPSDPSKQKEWVELKFEEAVSRTQQSRDIMDQSDYQTAGSWAQWMVTFMSTPILYGRVLAGAIRDVSKGLKSGDKKLTKKGLKTGLMFSAIAPLFFQVASTGGELILDSLGYGDDEEEDQLKAWKYNMAMIGVSFFQHIPILYPTFQNWVDYMVKGNDFDLSISAPMAITEKGFTSLRNIIKDVLDGEFDFSDESTQREINNVSRSLGLNYKGLVTLKDNWAQLFEEGSVEDIRLLLGYSEYSIE